MDDLDDLALLRAARPEPAPATDAEQAEIREQLMSILTDGATEVAAVAPDGGTVVDLTIDRRPRRRLTALVGGAAAVVVLATGVLALQAPGEGPLATAPASAAEQLRAIASTSEQLSPYPAGHYAVTRRDDLGTGAAPVDATDHVLGDGITLATNRCSPDGDFCVGGYSGGVGHPVLDRAVAGDIAGAVAHFSHPDSGAEMDPAGLAFELGHRVLRHPQATPAARAGVLRLLADTPGIVAEPGVANAFGRVGTSFSVEGRPDVRILIDPADGYLLGYRANGAMPPGSGERVVQFSWDRPVADPAIPAAVQPLADDLRTRRSTLVAQGTGMRCLEGHRYGGNTRLDWVPPLQYEVTNQPLVPLTPATATGVTVPEGWSFSLCW